MSIIDLFAGPGGWSTGLNMVGRSETIGIEWDKAACDTARAAGHNRLQADIAELDPFTVAGHDVEGLIASPPCQGFSMAGKGRGREDSELIIAAVADLASGLDPRDTLASKVKDERSVLALEPLRWALELEPEWMAWEQVPAVLPLWEACAEALRADGYEVWTGNVQAETLGVPQTRKRAILRARRGTLAPLTLTHSRYYPRSKDKLDPGVQKWVSMAEALTAARISYPDGARLCPTNLRPNAALRHPSEPAPTMAFGHEKPQWVYVNGNQANSAHRNTTEPAPTVHFGERMNLVTWQPTAANEGTTDEDMAWVHNRPSPTIVGSFAPGYRGPGDGPRQKAKGSVRVTVQEAAVLQSFPADYPWQGTKTAQYRQCGDAVPPLMAAHILASVGAGALPEHLANPPEFEQGDAPAWRLATNQGNPRDGYHSRDVDAPAQTVTAQCRSWNWRPSTTQNEEASA